RIALFLTRPAGMRHRAVDGGTHLLGVLPQIDGAIVVLARLPLRLARGAIPGGEFHVERTLHRIDLDDVAVADQADRAADRRLRPDMAHAETARGAREASLRDHRDFFSRALSVKRGRGREHFAHAGTAARPFVAD